MKIHEFTKPLLEEVSIPPVLYHFTRLKNAEQILKSGFNLVDTRENLHDAKVQPEGYPYFMSTTYDIKRGSYHRDATVGVMFNLSSSKLKQEGNILKEVKFFDDPDFNEFEIRVCSKNKTVGIDTINAIHVLLDSPKANAAVLKSIVEMAKKSNLPWAVYDNKTDWISQTNPIATQSKLGILNSLFQEESLIVRAIRSLYEAKTVDDVDKYLGMRFCQNWYWDEDAKSQLFNALNENKATLSEYFKEAGSVYKLHAFLIEKSKKFYD